MFPHKNRSKLWFPWWFIWHFVHALISYRKPHCPLVVIRHWKQKGGCLRQGCSHCSLLAQPKCRLDSAVCAPPLRRNSPAVADHTKLAHYYWLVNNLRSTMPLNTTPAFFFCFFLCPITLQWFPAGWRHSRKGALSPSSGLECITLQGQTNDQAEVYTRVWGSWKNSSTIQMNSENTDGNHSLLRFLCGNINEHHWPLGEFHGFENERLRWF